MSPSKSRSRTAFTLIEVMAAVLILGLFVAVLSEMLVRARRFEGDTRQLAEAAAVADREIARIEETLLRGAAPALGKLESGDPPWRVTSVVSAFDAALLGGGALGPEANATRGADGGDAARGSWLASPQAQQNPPLLEIEVRVSWEGAPADLETGEPLAISRRTFALNPAALESLPRESSEADDGGDLADEEDDGAGDEGEFDGDDEGLE